MMNRDFSDRFDSLMNSYAQKIPFGDQSSVPSLDFDEYEKSVFLTKAQEELVLNYYRGVNTMYKSFEQSEEVRRYLASLVETKVYNASDKITGYTGLDSSSVCFSYPDKLMFITYESVELSSSDACINGKRIDVIPVTQDDYNNMKNNPFRKPEGRAYRLDVASGIEIICKDSTLSKYIMRYLKRPSPIVLVDLPDGMEIEGVSEATECKLHENLHDELIERAVLLALNSRVRTSK